MVVGASGYVGSRLVSALSRAGHQVTASARDPKRLADFGFADVVGTVELDVLDRESCEAAFAGADKARPIEVAYYLVHSIGGKDFAERDRESAETFGAVARAAGVQRIVYLGGFVPAGEELSEHLASRAEVGETLTEITDPSAADTVWLRAAVILGAGSTSFELIRYMVERLPVVPLPRWMRHDVTPVAIDDVLRYLVAAGDRNAVPAGSYDISNGQTVTYAALIKAFARLGGHRRWWLPVRGVTPRMAAPIVAAITPIPKSLVADLVASLGNTMDSDDRRIRTFVPDPPAGLTTTDDAIVRSTRDSAVVSTTEQTDPLALASTDPDWAGGRHRMR